MEVSVMCTVTMNEDVKTKEDLQALITNTILEQKEGFLVQDILGSVEGNLKNSSLNGEKTLIESMIKETVQQFVFRSIILDTKSAYQIA